MAVMGQTPTLRYAGAMSALSQDADVFPNPVKLGIPGKDNIVGINQGWKDAFRCDQNDGARDTSWTLVHGGQCSNRHSGRPASRRASKYRSSPDVRRTGLTSCAWRTEYPGNMSTYLLAAFLASACRPDSHSAAMRVR